MVYRGRWEGSLTHDTYTWIIGMEDAPVWDPPAIPGYAAFKELSETSEQFPTTRQEFRIERRLQWEFMFVDLVLNLWAVTAVAGFLYLVMRRDQMDLILHCALVVAVTLVFAAAACCGLYLLVGGSGPPFPEAFGILGIIVGLAVGLITYHQMAQRRRRLQRRFFRPCGL